MRCLAFGHAINCHIINLNWMDFNLATCLHVRGKRYSPKKPNDELSRSLQVYSVCVCVLCACGMRVSYLVSDLWMNCNASWRRAKWESPRWIEQGYILFLTNTETCWPKTNSRWQKRNGAHFRGIRQGSGRARFASDSTRNQPFRGLEACVLNMTTVMPFVFSVITAFLFSEY